MAINQRTQSRMTRRAARMADVLAMPQTSIDHRTRDNRALGQAARAHRYDLSAAILQRSVRRPERNVGLELIALSFAERFADALAQGDALALLAWVEKTCIRYGDIPVIPRLLAAGTSSIVKAFGELGIATGNRQPEIQAITAQIDSIVARPRVSPDVIAADTLDEIDVALGELIERLDAADPSTAEHSRAVALWSARIGKRMGLSGPETIFVTRCGLVHDIGKMTTPPDILQAPRRLSNNEMNVMRRHAEDGGAIVAAIPLLAHHKPAVRWHHERLDGRGYPDGLAAAAIPLAARIVSVADSFNAMIGNRPYRLPMRPTAALEELQRHSGTQFDPDVISAMVDVLTKRS